MHCRRRLCALAVLAPLIPLAAAADEAGAQTPGRTGLDLMNQVVSETGAQIESRRYEQLPREAAQFERALEQLSESLNGSPAALRHQLEPLMAKARVASSAMAEAASSRKEAMIPVAHRQLAAAVKAINQALTPGAGPGPS